MGDRANVFIQEDEQGNGVYLYTHWNGTELPDTVRAALAKRWRWNDASYLARVVFCEMVKGVEGEETGYGISQRIGDGCTRVLVLDVPKQQVRFENRDRGVQIRPPKSFEAFVNSTKLWYDEEVTV